MVEVQYRPSRVIKLMGRGRRRKEKPGFEDAVRAMAAQGMKLGDAAKEFGVPLPTLQQRIDVAAKMRSATGTCTSFLSLSSRASSLLI